MTSMAFFAPAKAAACMGKWPSLFCVQTLAPCFNFDQREERDRQRKSFIRLQSCTGLFVLSCIQINSYCEVMMQAQLKYLYIPTCWEPHSYWWSWPESLGCFQGLPAGCSLWHYRTKAAVGHRCYKRWAPSNPCCNQVSYISTSALTILDIYLSTNYFFRPLKGDRPLVVGKKKSFFLIHFICLTKSWIHKRYLKKKS